MKACGTFSQASATFDSNEMTMEKGQCQTTTNVRFHGKYIFGSHTDLGHSYDLLIANMQGDYTCKVVKGFRICTCDTSLCNKEMGSESKSLNDIEAAVSSTAASSSTWPSADQLFYSNDPMLLSTFSRRPEPKTN
ncbi:hypothetical protein RvY_00038 [Ramazzottius varieornatus]|uniref:Uncharacterized protein n=1 Tax=Ramazzottius varieornatus TaxID=947166 RepID=A0A1D1UHM9_RAMVA|nr:hypothetical protein RvY_00038 [Ramazzottius varieornatus]